MVQTKVSRSVEYSVKDANKQYQKNREKLSSEYPYKILVLVLVVILFALSIHLAQTTYLLKSKPPPSIMICDIQDVTMTKKCKEYDPNNSIKIFGTQEHITFKEWYYQNIDIDTGNKYDGTRLLDRYYDEFESVAYWNAQITFKIWYMEHPSIEWYKSFEQLFGMEYRLYEEYINTQYPINITLSDAPRPDRIMITNPVTLFEIVLCASGFVCIIIILLKMFVSVGLSCEQLISLPEFRFDEIDDSTTQIDNENNIIKMNDGNRVCCICMKDYTDGDTLRVLSCDHHMHMDCCDPLLYSCNTCPVCQTVVSVDLMD